MAGREKRNVETLIATVLPLLLVGCFAFPCIIRKRTLGWYGAPPRTGDEAIMSGVGIMGLALLIHAWHLPFYRRFRVFRWFLVIVGALVFGVAGWLWFLRRALWAA